MRPLRGLVSDFFSRGSVAGFGSFAERGGRVPPPLRRREVRALARLGIADPYKGDR